jgi:uncharacterized protein YigA (DUF484 family)
MNRQNAMQARKISNSLLRQDNWVLRKNLKHLIRTTKRNIDIQNRIDDLGEMIVQCGELGSLVAQLTAELKDQFGLSAVTFCLSEEFMEMMAEDSAEQNREASACAAKSRGKRGIRRGEPVIGDSLTFIEKERLQGIFNGDTNPILREKLDYGSVDFFGMKQFRRIKSEAIIPLYHEKEFLGSLNLGSNNPIRYQKETATDYLKRLAQILSLALAVIKLKNHEKSKAEV